MRKGFILLLSLFSVGPARAADHLPVVFVHGVGIAAEFYEKQGAIKSLFARYGYELFVAHTPANGTLEQRARSLKEELDRLVPNGKLHIVAHSMGGLDARLAISEYGLGDRVASVTTIATPHRGTPIADLTAGCYLGQVHSPNCLWGLEFLRPFLPDLLSSLENMTTAYLEDFNKRVIDDPRVRYFSLAFFVPQPVERHSYSPWLWLSHAVLKNDGAADNDGLVPTESAKWGEVLGVYPGDHQMETDVSWPFNGGPGFKGVFRIIAENLNERFAR